ncbi:MAG TPA: DinB family protein [Terriglobales bacterium]|nr:DinB family protein [Terriglobales bacterium]
MHNPAPQWLTRTRTQLRDDFNDLDQQYIAMYNRNSREQVLWRPFKGAWSIAECVEHVALSISQYLKPIRAAIAKGAPPPAEQNYPFVAGGWFSNAFLKRIGPEVTSKFKAPGKLRPLSVDPERVFADLHRGHEEIQLLLAETAQLDLTRIRFRNPFIPVLRFTVATGFLVIAAHGRRHLLQAERVTKADGFPQSKAQQNV